MSMVNKDVYNSSEPQSVSERSQQIKTDCCRIRQLSLLTCWQSATSFWITR